MTMKAPHVAALAVAAILAPGLAFGQAGTGKPANLCQELVTFVHPPAPAPAPAPAAGGQPTPAVQAPSSGQPGGGASAAAGETQQKSGLSGPVTQTGPGAAGPQGAAQAGQGAAQPAQGAAQPGAQAEAKPPAAPPPAAPATPAPPPPPKPTPDMIERVDAAARDNNISACRDAARQMRVAGIAMPAPLLALSALDPKFFEAAR
ncbi:hypothetical protein [Methylobacterium oxalidis]|uniref:Uncharacterized protein n=1 Tax=Methylobacterium oxalidis TaxID=944322 RepID=A0A512J744_9HYPH|nr:hypothetical protein [Methylobacterium oxalidis]GEP05791.1 hypothetical protein MOX02_38290 [Methylobacterium oxalidis]GJE35329.1 hypothetical protein LDDCCGHA_5547 [Methylobacterium oxalidis]GLS62626.1 hypothetical protein GCM10007888_10070 [Methylobacterium oxalidis]